MSSSSGQKRMKKLVRIGFVTKNLFFVNFKNINECTNKRYSGIPVQVREV